MQTTDLVSHNRVYESSNLNQYLAELGAMEDAPAAAKVEGGDAKKPDAKPKADKKPAGAPKKEEPKADAPKKEEPKKDAPRKEEPKADAPKKSAADDKPATPAPAAATPAPATISPAPAAPAPVAPAPLPATAPAPVAALPAVKRKPAPGTTSRGAVKPGEVIELDTLNDPVLKETKDGLAVETSALNT